MGHSYKFECAKCKRYQTKDFLFGIGAMYAPKNIPTFLEYFFSSEEIRKEIQSLFQEGASLKMNDYGHALYLCESCNQLHSHFFIHLEHNGKVYEPKLSCPKCQKILTLVTIESKKGRDLFYTDDEMVKIVGHYDQTVQHQCPHCDNETFKVLSVLNWD